MNPRVDVPPAAPVDVPPAAPVDVPPAVPPAANVEVPPAVPLADGVDLRPGARVDVPLAARLIAVAAVAAITAAVAALLVGFAVYWIVLSASSDSDVWAELGAAIFGVLLGLAAAVLTYSAATVVAVRRVLPAGRRIRPALAVLVLPIALAVTLSLPVLVAAASSYEWLVAMAMVLAAGGVVVGVALVAGVVENKRGLSVLAALLLGALVVTGTAAVASAAAERDERRAAIRRFDALPLVDGVRLDEPYPGWELQEVRADESAGSIDITWDLPASQGTDAHLSVSSTGEVEVRVHAGDLGLLIEETLRARLRMVGPEEFLRACGHRC